MTESRAGLAYALTSYILWGLFPVYWKLLDHVPAVETLTHRIIWAFPFVGMLLLASSRGNKPRLIALDAKCYFMLLLTSAVISVNWGLYIWAVNHQFVTAASLGYFLTPLFNVLMGLIVFKEKLRKSQWFALGFAVIGIVLEAINTASGLWVALALGLSFALYGMLRKLVAVNSVTGLFVETALLAPFAIGFAVYLANTQQAYFSHAGLATSTLLIIGGVVTAIPLLFYAAAAKRLALSTLGMVFFLTPSLQFICGVFIYREAFAIQQWLSYALIWLGLLVYCLDLRATKTHTAGLSDSRA